jgi:hypothetical protein
MVSAQQQQRCHLIALSMTARWGWSVEVADCENSGIPWEFKNSDSDVHVTCDCDTLTVTCDCDSNSVKRM